MSAPTVFISYSHKDEVWKDRLVPHLEALRQAGVEMQVWHDRKIDGGDKWYPEIREAMVNAAAAILMISSDFLASGFCIQEEVPNLLKRQEELGMLLVPVLVRQCPWKAHRWLKDRQMIPRDGKSVAIDFAGDQSDNVFAAVAEQVLAHFQQLPSALTATIGLFGVIPELLDEQRVTVDGSIIPPPTVVRWPPVPAKLIDLTHLPETGKELFGRDAELESMDRAWDSDDQSVDRAVRVIAFTAHGGVGKSTLVNHWLTEMARENYRGATRVFGWSFFSQGVREENVASADSFIDAALRFFGDADPTAGSPWDKGARLAGLVGSQRALLVLDGMEPLQSPYEFERGKLRDPALESLLRGLARHSVGLCLITTREPVPDLAGRSGVVTRDLEQIDVKAGRALLRTARVIGTDEELEALADRFGPHALSITLLGVYLYEQPRHGIAPAKKLEQLPGEKAIDKVLAGFENWLGDCPEREALSLLGFFDRPADEGCLAALRKAPPIAGLTDHLSDLSDAEWDRVLDRLGSLRLIHVTQNQSGKQFVDAHPLIREHFAQLLKNSETWRAGHKRLYEYLCDTTREGDEPTLEDLQPLYQAVAHGCQAGLQQEACDDVYFARICREQFYSAKKLGAFDSDLGAIACFFEQPWAKASHALAESDQAWLLNLASAFLCALGRLIDAREPMRTAVEMCVKQQDWREAARNANNLSELELMLGEVSLAVRDAEQSVTYADRSGDAHQRCETRSTHADALHQAGLQVDALEIFREAEQMQREISLDCPLYSVRGFKYCDLLLAAPERAAWQMIVKRGDKRQRDVGGVQTCRAISQRAAQTLKVAEQYDLGLLDIGLDHLTLGRAALFAAVLERSESKTSKSIIENALGGLRRAGTMHHIPHALLTRAWLRFLSGAGTGFQSAQEDLDEAWEIAERGPMRLHMADIHLYRARLFYKVKPYPWNKFEDGREGRGAKDDLDAAEELINKCGYHRRDEELADAKLAILGTT
jgi:hypothetical protein